MLYRLPESERVCSGICSTKLRVRDKGEVNGFDYLGSLTYRKSGAGLQLESASFGDGVIRPGASNGVKAR